MAPVSLSHVVRFSSQDTVFKAESLCRGKADASGTWKCAKEDISRGRMEAEFQLERASYIGHIDIGGFSRQTIENQWDRIRLICRQPYRKDKQFGLSFIRVASVPEESSGEDVSQANNLLATKVNNTNDEDGVLRLKKASGLMGCLRNLDKGKCSEVPLNRAGKMLQAALDSRSPTTPRHKPKIETSSSNHKLPCRKRTSQSLSEGPTDKKRKSPKQSLAGNIHDEVALFLEEIDFTKIDLEQVTFKDLRNQMELQRGCALTKLEKEIFLQMVKADLETSVGGNEAIKQSCNKLPNSSPEEMIKDKVASHNTSHASVSLSPVTDIPSDDELLPMLNSPKKNKPSSTCQKTKESQPLFDESTPRVPFLVECPICSRFYPRSEVEFHAALCTGLSLNAASHSPRCTDDRVPCPVCSKLFPSTEIEQHADDCAESSIRADDNNFARELISLS